MFESLYQRSTDYTDHELIEEVIRLSVTLCLRASIGGVQTILTMN